MNTLRTAAAVLLAGSLALACGDNGNGGNGGSGGGGSGGTGAAGGTGGNDECAAEGQGTLRVLVTGLPQGAEPDVRVDGELIPTGSGAGTFAHPGGNAEITAGDVTVSAPIVRPIYRATAASQTVCVADGETTDVSIVYEQIATSGRLWGATSNETAHVVAWDAALLDTSAEPVPSVLADATTAGGEGAPSSITFDRDGNLWAAYAAGELRRFPAAAIGAGGEPEPDVILSGDGLGRGLPGPTALAFDHAGNLWVAIGVEDRVARFTPEQIGTSGEPLAEVSIGGEGSGIDGPRGLAFDDAGNLWISTANNLLVRYDAGRLGASSSDPADRIIEAQLPGGGGRLSGPSGLAFDDDNNLWVTFFGPNVIGKLESGQLAGTGEADMEPIVQITVGLSALLDGIAFDEAGGLWVALGAPGIGRYNTGSLLASGDKSPDTLIGGTHVTDLAFFPASRELPLWHAVPPADAQQQQ